MIQKTMSNYMNFLEDTYGDMYEETWAASSQFGCSQTNTIMLAILGQMKEMNRLMYNKFEARQ